MTDNLDRLSDTGLSAVFAVEVAGLIKTMNTGKLAELLWCDPKDGRLSLESFATDASAVLPWLEKWPLVEIHLVSGEWQVALCERYRDARGEHESVIAEGEGAIFASAACIALIRAKRKATA